MARGRRPLPTAVKDLRGNPGKRPQNLNEPQIEVGDPEMPVGLSDAAKKEWDAMVPHLKKMGVLTPVDRSALAGYCYAFDIWMRANEEIKQFGILLKTPIMGRKGTAEEGTIVAYITEKNPAVAIANEALKTKKSFLIEFGMTPASRSKLHVEKPKNPDPADLYFQKKTNARHVVN